MTLYYASEYIWGIRISSLTDIKTFEGGFFFFFFFFFCKSELFSFGLVWFGFCFLITQDFRFLNGIIFWSDGCQFLWNCLSIRSMKNFHHFKTSTTNNWFDQLLEMEVMYKEAIIDMLRIKPTLVFLYSQYFFLNSWVRQLINMLYTVMCVCVCVCVCVLLLY